MSTLTATVTEISKHFSEYINRVAYGKDKFILLRGGKPLAELRPCGTSKTMAELSDILKSLPKLSTEDLKTFDKDLKSYRKSINMEKSDAWDA